MKKIPVELSEYYQKLLEKIESEKKIAIEARKRIASPTPYVEVMFARDLAERVELLVGPKGIAEKIRSVFHKMPLEKLALKLAEDIILEYGEGETDRKVLLQAIRTSLAILTPPCITAAPTEGIVDVKIKKNTDGSRYLALYFAGPIRSAGGTELAAVVVLADYVRKLVGLDRYKPTYEEIMRFIEELKLYKKKVSRFQYNVPDNIIEYVLKNLPVEVTGIPTDKIQVSSFRNIPRVETNYLRGGALRVVNDGIAGRAKKVLKLVEKTGIDGWDWIRDVVKIMEEAKNEEESYFDEVVGGRPIISLPDRFGGLRIRYGRAPTTGMASVGLHPLTLEILNWYIVSGTQLKLDYPGKGGVVATVDSIEPPVVLTEEESVVRLDSYSKYEKVKGKIKKILFLGDILISAGDLIENNVKLQPPGYCEEWWAQELRLKYLQFREKLDGELADKIKLFIENPFINTPEIEDAIKISFKLGVPLHPRYTAFWRNITVEEVEILRRWLKNGLQPLIYKNSEIHLPYAQDVKNILTKLLIEHRLESGMIVIPKYWLKTLITILQPFKKVDIVGEETLSFLSKISNIEIRDKAGAFIGARMGRPEKAAQREMRPPVNVLFPVGIAGGPSRDLVSASNNYKKIVVELVRRRCPSCGVKTWRHRCSKCGVLTEIVGVCSSCNLELEYNGEKVCSKCGGQITYHEKFVVNISELLYEASRNLDEPIPSKIKGVKSLTSLTRTPELLEKGIIRAKYGLYIYKDGTVRFDVTNAPLTHFTPEMIGTSIEKLRELGYTHDIYGEPLISTKQILRLKIQDIVVPRKAAEHLFKVSKMVDEELKKIAGIDPYYNFEKIEDIVGELVVVMSPHTYAASVARVIGIVDGNMCFAHPILHAAKRRDCDGDEDSIMLLLDVLINFSQFYLPHKIGGKMDSPLLITMIVYPEEVDEQAHNLDVASQYPLEFYRKALEQRHVSEVANLIPTIKNYLNRDESYIATSYTHPTSVFVSNMKESTYKKHSSMLDKISGQIEIAEKLTSVDIFMVVEKIMKSHLLPDIIGNAKAFFTQEFRCRKCGTRYRRIPISGQCYECGGELSQTVFKGAVEKYIDLTEELLSKYVKTPYLKEHISISLKNIKQLFAKGGIEETSGKQISLERFF
ncbi:MAG: DNA polymerase II large subunit [Nitrososphaerota archaeon]